MWHDYAIAGHPPDQDPDKGPFDALYDAVRDHFASERVYAPAIAEVIAKLAIAQRGRFTAQWASGNAVVITTLDLSRLTSAERPQLAGMGLRVNKPGATIIAAEVDGAALPAFTADTVILPPRTAATALVKITTGDPALAARPRLTYLSKAPAAITAPSGNLRVDLARPGLLTRFCLVPPTRHVLIGVDRYAPETTETCGRLNDGSSAASFEARALSAPASLSFTAADRRIAAQRTSGSQVQLDVAAGRSADRIIFRATTAPDEVHVGSRAVSPTVKDGTYTITLGTSSAATVTLDF
jgi:hypothetical protein